MKKSFIKSALLLMAMAVMPSVNVNAQDEEVAASAKTSIFLDMSSGRNYADRKTVLNSIMSAMQKTGRMIIMDSESGEGAKFIEKYNVDAVSDMADGRLAEASKLGIQYYVTFTVDDIKYTHAYDATLGKSSAKCQAIVTGKIFDPKTSSVSATSQMTFEGYDSDNSEAKALQALISSIAQSKTVLSANPLNKFIDENFPITAQLIEINESKKDKAISVYINAGSDNGVAKDTKFEVFKEKKIGTRVGQTKIAELSVQEIQGGDLTLCKVTKGGDVIQTEFNNGSTLRVKSRAKKAGVLDSMSKIGL